MVNTGYRRWCYYIGKMVNAANGNLYHPSGIDISLRIRGFGKQMSIIRSYNSNKTNVITDLGRGWTFNYGIKLEDNISNVRICQPDGSVDEFISTGGGNYSSSAGVHSKLVKYVDHFKLFNIDGSYHRFDFNGRLAKQVDKNGNEINIFYNNDKITQISDDSGMELTFTYNNDDLIESITDQLNRQVNYYYDVNRNLVRVNDPMNNDTIYSYKPNNLLQAIINPEKRIIGVLYDGSARAEKITIGIYDDEPIDIQYLNSLQTFYDITYNGLIVSFLDANSHQTQVTLNVSGNPVIISDACSNSEIYSWDADMNVTGFTDRNGKTTQYSYDSYGNMTDLTDPYNNTEIYDWITPSSIPPPNLYISLLRTFTDKNNRSTEYEYDQSGNLTTVTNPLNNSQSFVYDQYGNTISFTDFNSKTSQYNYIYGRDMVEFTDPDNNVTSYEHDAAGRIIKVIDANDNETSYGYDNKDNVTIVTDALLHETTYEYDKVGNIISKTDANQHTTCYEYDPLVNKLSKVIDPCNEDKTYVYDLVGNLLSETNELGKTTDYQYDDVDRLIRETDPLSHYDEYSYDNVGNVLSHTDKNGKTTVNGYDDLNRLIRVTDPLNHHEIYSYDGVGNMIFFTDKNGNSTTHQYDDLNQLVRETDALNHYDEYVYDEVGNVTQMTDKNGNSTSYDYDDLNRLIKITDPCQNETEYAYDNVGNKIRMTDANNHQTNYTYDAFNRLLTIESQLGKTTTYQYDNLGNLIHIEDPIGNETIIGYNSCNKVINKEFKDNQGATKKNIAFTYDANGKLLTANGGGFGIVTNVYDDMNRLTSYTLDYGPFSKTTQYSYDNSGRIVSMTNPDNEVTCYAYDDAGRLILLEDPGAGVFQFLYDNAGRRMRLTYPGGGYLDNQYDDANRLLSIQPTNLSVSAISYYYDANGNRLTMTIGAVTTTYTYTARNELLTELRNGYNAAYTYDPVGNRLTSEINGNPLSYTYDDDNRLISTSDGKSYSYDDNGNVIELDDNNNITRYEYDIENYLIKTVLPNNDTYEYLICPLGIRIAKTTPNTVEYYGYDRGSRVMKYDSNGSTISKYAQNPSEVDETLGYLSAPSWVYNTMDGLHTIRNELDYNGNLLSQKDYDAYGVSIGGTPTEYGFTGRIFDPESSLYYYRARMYDPRVGRFISKDPLGLLRASLDELYDFIDDKREIYGSISNAVYPNLYSSINSPFNTIPNNSPFNIIPNPYFYCFNNPVNYIDPNGMATCNGYWYPKWPKCCKKRKWGICTRWGRGCLVTSDFITCMIMRGVTNTSLIWSCVTAISACIVAIVAYGAGLICLAIIGGTCVGIFATFALICLGLSTKCI